MSMISHGILLLDRALKLKISGLQVNTWCKKSLTFNYLTTSIIIFFKIKPFASSDPQGLTPSQRRDHKEKERKRLRQLEYI